MKNKNRLILIVMTTALSCLSAGVLFYKYADNWRYETYVKAIAFRPDGRRILTVENGVEMFLWSVETGNEESRLVKPYHGGGADHIAFGPHGQKAVTGGTDGVVLWDIEHSGMIRVFEGSFPSRSRINGPAVAFSPDGQMILSGDAGESIRIWDTQSGELLMGINDNGIDDNGKPNPDSSILSVVFSPDGRFALSCGENLKLWDIRSGQKIRSFIGHKKPILAAAFSSDGRKVVSGSQDKTFKVWSVETGRQLESSANDLFPTVISFSHDGNYALTGSFDGSIKLWDIQRGRSIRSFPQNGIDEILSLSFSPDMKKVVTGCILQKKDKSKTGCLLLLDLQTGEIVRKFKKKVSLPRILMNIVWDYVKI